MVVFQIPPPILDVGKGNIIFSKSFSRQEWPRVWACSSPGCVGVMCGLGWGALVQLLFPPRLLCLLCYPSMQGVQAALWWASDAPIDSLGLSPELVSLLSVLVFCFPYSPQPPASTICGGDSAKCLQSFAHPLCHIVLCVGPTNTHSLSTERLLICFWLLRGGALTSQTSTLST